MDRAWTSGSQHLLKSFAREDRVSRDRQPARHRRQQRRRTSTPVCSTSVHADRAGGGVRWFCHNHRSSSDLKRRVYPIGMPVRRADGRRAIRRDSRVNRGRCRRCRRDSREAGVGGARRSPRRTVLRRGRNTRRGCSLPTRCRTDDQTSGRHDTGRPGLNRARRPNIAAHAPQMPSRLWTDHELEVDPGARPERTRPLDEGAARAQVDERHGVAGPEDRLRARDHRLAETRVGPTIC